MRSHRSGTTRRKSFRWLLTLLLPHNLLPRALPTLSPAPFPTLPPLPPRPALSLPRPAHPRPSPPALIRPAAAAQGLERWESGRGHSSRTATPRPHTVLLGRGYRACLPHAPGMREGAWELRLQAGEAEYRDPGPGSRSSAHKLGERRGRRPRPGPLRSPLDCPTAPGEEKVC